LKGLPGSVCSPVGDEIVHEMRFVQLSTQSFTVTEEILCFVVTSMWLERSVPSCVTASIGSASRDNQSTVSAKLGPVSTDATRREAVAAALAILRPPDTVSVVGELRSSDAQAAPAARAEVAANLRVRRKTLRCATLADYGSLGRFPLAQRLAGKIGHVT
jgi:hypothetical protein